MVKSDGYRLEAIDIAGKRSIPLGSDRYRYHSNNLTMKGKKARIRRGLVNLAEFRDELSEFSGAKLGELSVAAKFAKLS